MGIKAYILSSNCLPAYLQSSNSGAGGMAPLQDRNDIRIIKISRVVHADFHMGGELSPPHRGGTVGGGDKGPMGGDWHVIHDKAGW